MPGMLICSRIGLWILETKLSCLFGSSFALAVRCFALTPASCCAGFVWLRAQSQCVLYVCASFLECAPAVLPRSTCSRMLFFFLFLARVVDTAEYKGLLRGRIGCMLCFAHVVLSQRVNALL